jgi:ribosomal protein L4
VITPQISAAGVEHLDTLFQAYINVEPDAVRRAVISKFRKRRSATHVISTA